LWLSSLLPHRKPSRLLDPWYRRLISQDNKASHSNAFCGPSYLLQWKFMRH
jgi:hypothetical protein